MTLRQWMLAGVMSATLMGSVAPAYAQRGPDGPQRGARAGDQSGGPRVERAQRGPEGRNAGRAEWRQDRQARDTPDRARNDWRGDRAVQSDRTPDWRRNGQGANWQNGRQDGQDRRATNDWRGNERNDWRRDGRQDWRGRQLGRTSDPRWVEQRRFDDRTRWSNQRRWDDGWRRDSRYGWRDYRAVHGDRFRAGRYYAPRGWDYGYQRFSVGILLSSMLYSNSYWLSDPWSYRLPPAYGSLQWVRYYDDALLVDTRDGYVADVIHDFFW